MTFEDVLSGPAATLAGGVGGVLTTQLGYWLVLRRRARARQAEEALGVARVRLDNEETANERLFRNIDERLKLSEQRYAECEQQKQALETRVNALAGTIIRLSAALDIMRAGYASAGLRVPPLPRLGADEG